MRTPADVAFQLLYIVSAESPQFKSLYKPIVILNIHIFYIVSTLFNCVVYFLRSVDLEKNQNAGKKLSKLAIGSSSWTKIKTNRH